MLREGLRSLARGERSSTSPARATGTPASPTASLREVPALLRLPHRAQHDARESERIAKREMIDFFKRELADAHVDARARRCDDDDAMF